jgi:hypothetical protein
MALGAYALWSFASGDELSDGDRVANQLWVTKLPQDDRDMIDHLVLIDDDGERWGLRGRSSAWRHDLEIFQWGREQERLLLYFPQTRSKGQWKVRFWRCADEAPKPFELCLEISGDGAPRRFYSRDDWAIDSGDAADSLASIAEGTPELAHHLDPASFAAPDGE